MSAPISFSGALDGDSRQIEVFGSRVGRAGSPAGMRSLSRAIGNAALLEVQVGFATSTDPYGNPWEPKLFTDGNKPLVKTGKLRAGWFLAYAGADSAIIANRQRYAVFQGGTGIYGPSGQRIQPNRGRALSWRSQGKRFAFRSVRGSPPRLMVPRAGDIPPRWNRAIAIAVREHLRARLTGR